MSFMISSYLLLICKLLIHDSYCISIIKMVFIQLEILKMLLENGGDPNVPDNCNGSTPVHMAAKLGKFISCALCWV